MIAPLVGIVALLSHLPTQPLGLTLSMQDVLESAEQLAREGKYEESLQKHIWFHENALKFEPAMYGVRLSSAAAIYSIAEEDLYEAGELEICSKMTPDPMRSFDRLSESRTRLQEASKRLGNPDIAASTNGRFEKSVCRLLKILITADRRPEAMDIRAAAAELDQDAKFAAAMDAVITPPKGP